METYPSIEDLLLELERTYKNVLEVVLSRASEVKSNFASAKRWLDRMDTLGESRIAALQALEYAGEITDNLELATQYLDLAITYDQTLQEAAAEVRSKLLYGELQNN